MVTIRIEGIPELRHKLDNPNLIAGPVREFLLKSSFTVEGKAKQLAPVDTGRLRASITSIIRPTQAMVAPTVNYGAAVEYGTRPHFPPPDALEGWARRHGFPSAGGAFLLARSISRRGTRPQPYMRPAATQSQPDISRFAGEMALAIEARFRSGV